MGNMKNFILVLVTVLSVSSPLSAQRLGLSSDAVDLMTFGTLGIEGSLGIAQHFSADLGGNYDPWTFREGTEDQFQAKRRSFWGGIRYWPWHVFSGFWFKGSGRWIEYNWGGISERSTEEGRAWMGGLSLGYSYMVTDRVNLDIGTGLWLGPKEYTVYECPRCGRILEEGSKTWMVPDLSLSVQVILF